MIVCSRDVRERVRALGVEEGAHSFDSPRRGLPAIQGWRTARSPGEGGWRILYVGRYDPRKGIGVLLQAMPLVRRRADVRLQLVGGSAASGQRPIIAAKSPRCNWLIASNLFPSSPTTR